MFIIYQLQRMKSLKGQEINNINVSRMNFINKLREDCKDENKRECY